MINQLATKNLTLSLSLLFHGIRKTHEEIHSYIVQASMRIVILFYNDS